MLCISILRLGRWNVYWVLKQPIGLFVVNNVDRRRCEQGPPISLLPSLDAGGFLPFFFSNTTTTTSFFWGSFFGGVFLGKEVEIIVSVSISCVDVGFGGALLVPNFYLLTPFCCSTMTALRAVSFGGFFFVKSRFH